ncbi:MAG: HAD family phosphatase [Candidatus Omnitrophica bacterium]|nr:HAD family phosphatase [Candidatus Omnitrophota bacterium]
MIKASRETVIKTTVVIFDMDGVITNTMPDHFEAWRTVLGERGIKVTHLDIYRREGQRGITSVSEIFADYKQPFNLKDANAILLRKEELFKKNTRKRFIVGTRSLLKSLKRMGFTLAIVTGTARHELHQILPDNIYNLFTVVVTGDDVKNGKPSPEPYLLALKKLSISAEQGVVIENAPFGITAAKAAKLRCLAIATSLSKEYLRDADEVFTSIKDLRENITFIYTK